MLLKIKNQINYNKNYISPLLRGMDDVQNPKPWNLISEISNYCTPSKILMDIGCGTGHKIIPLSSKLNQIIGLDSNFEMLQMAKKMISGSKANNMNLIRASTNHLPLDDKSIDIITIMLAPWDAKEISRILKPDGIAIIEYIGCEDKKDFKLFFGKDKLGLRGQFLEYSVNEFLQLIKFDFSRFFYSVSIQNGFWNTYYSIEGLEELLDNTPTIRNYDNKSDKNNLKKAIKCFNTNKGIKLTQNRILIHAKNPRFI